jgi:hypothetical protein
MENLLQQLNALIASKEINPEDFYFIGIDKSGEITCQGDATAENLNLYIKYGKPILQDNNIFIIRHENIRFLFSLPIK